MKKELTIIIVTYNSQKIIPISLARLNGEKYHIIIVDNSSNDNTVKIIQEQFPNIEIIQNQQNIGFARANNIALKKVTNDFALILNPDAFIDEANIDKIIKVMQANANLALASAITYNCALDMQQNKIIDAKPCGISQRNLLTNQGDFYKAKFITGACMFMKMTIFRKIGFFDENFFMYCEDNELNKRTKNKGYDLGIVDNTKFFHLNSQSSGQHNSRTLYLILWHKLGWSKMYYTQAIHNKFIAKLKSLRKIIQISSKIFLNLIKYQTIYLGDKAALSGSFAYLIGKKAFDENDHPNGRLHKS